MKSVEKSAKNVEEAVDAALFELALTRDDVEIEVLEEGSKGIFGFGSKNARVKVTEKDTFESRAIHFLEKVCSYLDVTPSFHCHREDNILKIQMEGPGMGAVIGHRGETLDALQYLTTLAARKDGFQDEKLMLDAENYRAKREESLIKLANKMAAKCERTGRRVALEPMNPYERRILHFALQDHPTVTTMSEGVEPRRRVIILPK
jgi:spoIIIJ-associated protein